MPRGSRCRVREAIARALYELLRLRRRYWHGLALPLVRRGAGLLALPPDVVRWVSRNGEDGDCAIAAIALATGTTYEQALAAAVLANGERAQRLGMYTREIQKTITHLGFRYRMRRKYDVDEDTGLLFVVSLDGTEEHVVYLWDGRIIEPRLDRRSLWRDPEAFLEHEGWEAGALLTVKKD